MTVTAEPTTTGVEHAEQEAREAADLVEALKQRVRDGDTGVSADEIGEATKLAEYAHLRVEAAQKKAEQERERRRQERLQDAADRLRKIGDPEHLFALLKAADDALGAFIDACEERKPTLDEIRRIMHETGVGAAGAGRLGDAGDAGLAWSRFGDDIGVNGRWVRPIKTGAVVAALIRRHAQAHRGLPYGGTSLGAIKSGSNDPYAVLRSQG